MEKFLGSFPMTLTGLGKNGGGRPRGTGTAVGGRFDPRGKTFMVGQPCKKTSFLALVLARKSLNFCTGSYITGIVGFSTPSLAVTLLLLGGHNEGWDDYRWGTLAALHPGDITVVRTGVMMKVWATTFGVSLQHYIRGSQR